MSDENKTVVIGPCFYFGCKDKPGHYLFNEAGWSASRSIEKELPFRFDILDGGLLPPGKPQVEGQAAVVHIANYTVLTFWDRSVDSRGGCNSSFIIPAILDFNGAMVIAKKRFPWVWNRFTFEVALRDEI